jgi:hypothetical protein
MLMALLFGTGEEEEYDRGEAGPSTLMAPWFGTGGEESDRGEAGCLPREGLPPEGLLPPGGLQGSFPDHPMKNDLPYCRFFWTFDVSEWNNTNMNMRTTQGT